MMRRGSTRTAVRCSAAITRSYSSQSSWLPPAALNTSRQQARDRRRRETWQLVVGSGQAHRSLDRDPLPTRPEHDRRVRPRTQVAQLAGVAPGHETDDVLVGHRVAEDAGIDDRCVHGLVRPDDRDHHESMVGCADPTNRPEVSGHPRCLPPPPPSRNAPPPPLPCRPALRPCPPSLPSAPATARISHIVDAATERCG